MWPMKCISKRLLFIILLLPISICIWADTLRFVITGLPANALKNAQDRLAVLQQNDGNPINENSIQTIFNNSAANIRQAIEPYGYFKATIQSNLKQQRTAWIASFNISPGPQLLINHVDIQITGPGANDPELQKLLNNFTLRANRPLLIEDYNKAIQLLFQTANNQGYLKAWLEKKEIRINLQQYHSEIILHMNTGPQYYFGEFSFKPNAFDPAFLQRFVTLKNGKPFSSQQLLVFQQDLANSQYFQQVSVSPDLEKVHDYLVPINIDALPRTAKQYNFGIGWGTFTGPRFTAGADWRRATNTGQHFNMQLKVSPVLSGLAAKYFIPGKNPLTDQYTIGANIQQFIPRNGRSFSETLSGAYVKSVREWQHTLSINYLRERFMINDNPWQSSNILYPALTISRIKSDDLINTHEGSAVNWNIQGASDNILSQTSFLQSEIKAKYITSPTQYSRFILRGDLGYTVVSNIQRLPLTLQFFAGGPSSVRGYRFDSIGPGRYLKVGSVELQHRIYGDWGAAVFYDAGIAANHFNTPSQHSRGIGIIYNSLIGPIKLYVARADSTPGKPLRIDFNIGPDF